MIKATGRTGNGLPLLALGLSGETVTRLMANEPIALNLADMGLPAVAVLIVGGRTDEDITDQLRAHGLLGVDETAILDEAHWRTQRPAGDT